jgi:hypothetical protein
MGPEVLPSKHMTYTSTNARYTLDRAKISLEPNTRLVLVHNSSCVQNLELVTWVQIQRVVF